MTEPMCRRATNVKSKYSRVVVAADRSICGELNVQCRFWYVSAWKANSETLSASRLTPTWHTVPCFKSNVILSSVCPAVTQSRSPPGEDNPVPTASVVAASREVFGGGEKKNEKEKVHNKVVECGTRVAWKRRLSLMPLTCLGTTLYFYPPASRPNNGENTCCISWPNHKLTLWSY